MTENEYQKHLYVAILCGGGGTRVWPLSVKDKPKQFLNFYSDKTLYQETLERAKRLTEVKNIFIVTNKNFENEIRIESPEIPEENIISEPYKRNTAMAMGVVAAYIKKRDSNGVLINLASDSVIIDLDLYISTLKAAAKTAYEDRKLVAVGIVPQFPHPGLGYIHIGEKIKEESGNPVYYVDCFYEKPDYETAKQYVESGEYLWNANNYIWRVDVVMDAFDTYSPEIASTIHNIEAAIGTPEEKTILTSEYEKAKQEQIDTAISEKAKDMWVIPGKFGWHDIGGWQVVYELGEKDENGNVVIHNKDGNAKTPAVILDAKNNLIYLNNQPLAVVGLSNTVVVDTGTGVLVCDREKSNDVKKVVEKLIADGFEEYT